MCLCVFVSVRFQVYCFFFSFRFFPFFSVFRSGGGEWMRAGSSAPSAYDCHRNKCCAVSSWGFVWSDWTEGVLQSTDRPMGYGHKLVCQCG